MPQGSVAVVVVVLAASACNQVFALDQTHSAVDSSIYDVCAPLPFDPNRYYAAPGTGTWMQSRTACQSRGMDLAVIDANDPTEIADELDGGTTPFWYGVSFDGSQWQAIDNCTSYLPTPPPVGMAGDCLINAGTMQALPCDENMAGTTINGLCETPRPDARCLMLESHSTYAVASTTDVGYAVAVGMCSGMNMHIVEINTSAELESVVQTYGGGLDAFWLAAQVGASGLTSATTCPQVFAWADSQPNFGGGDTCVEYTPSGMTIATCNTSAAVICEANAAM